MTNLKDINFGINQFCGPAVLSALTGKSTDECAAVISSINGRREIRAVSTDELIKAIEKLRFDVIKSAREKGSLYATFMGLIGSDGMYVIIIPKHVIAAEVRDEEIFLIDNHSKQPINAAHSARLMQKVEAVYKVVKKAEPKLIREYIKVMKTNLQVLDIVRMCEYEDSKDNTLVSLGHIVFKDNEELDRIIEQLAVGRR